MTSSPEFTRHILLDYGNPVSIPVKALTDTGTHLDDPSGEAPPYYYPRGLAPADLVYNGPKGSTCDRF
jgi:hypothetical protein